MKVRIIRIVIGAFAENGQYPETNPRDMSRLAVTQNPVKRTSANTDVKNSKGVNNNDIKNCQWEYLDLVTNRRFCLLWFCWVLWHINHCRLLNALKLKTAQYQLAGIYIKEQTEYIQNQIEKIRDSVEDRQSRIAWQTINEVSRRKNTAKAKLKAANQQERIKLWKRHFENLLGNPPKITHEPITRIISKQLDIKLGPFTQEELNSVLRKIKNRKAAGLDEIPPEVWKTRQFDDILLRHCNAVYNQNPIDRWMKGCILPFPEKGDLGLAKNYRGITLTSIAAKIYNALLRNRIEHKIDNILRKIQNGFRRNRSTTSQILTIRRILEGVRAKNLQATLIFVDFTKAFDSIHRGKMEQILLAYGIPKETVAAITILDRNTKVKVRSPDGDTEFSTLY